MVIFSILRSHKKRRLLILSVALALLMGFTVWVIHSNTVPTLTEISVPAKGLPEGFDGFRIVQVSDLHDTELGRNHEKAIDLIRKAKPDVIFLTGDMIDGHEERTDVALTVDFVRQAMEIAPCYYVTGNHEGMLSYETYTRLESELISLGVKVLHRESVTLVRNRNTVTVVGIDSPSFFHPNLPITDLSWLCENNYSILLAHHPEHVDGYAAAGADLIFSGHAHGGQFRLPFVGGLFAPGQGFFPAYDGGLYTVPSEEGEALLCVNRGLGNSGFPVRFANRPEVILAVLESQ
jgi:predicted MPP superfamily phosphohydrolase